MDWLSLIAILISILLFGFFSGIDIAFFSASKLSIELSKKQGKLSGKFWSKFSDNNLQLTGSLIVGSILVLTIYGLLIGNLLYPVWHWIKAMLPLSAADYVDYIRLLVETILSTTIIIFTVFISRAIFKAKSNNLIVSDALSYAFGFFYSMLTNVSTFSNNIADWVLKYILNVKIQDKKDGFGKFDLEHFMQQSRQYDDEENNEINQELFENALSLSEVKLRECLIPRKEIVAVDSKTSVENIKKKFIETKLSKIVVFDENIDNIIGYIHHLDLFKNPTTLNEIIHPIPTVPESMSATDLMNKFSKERKSIAWVIDEFGGTAGIVTMEDLLEEIFGEIEDEFDLPETFVAQQIAQNEYIFSGRLELDFITQKFHILFEGNDGAETLSGYIIQNHEYIPKQKEKIIVGNFEFTIISVSETRIETVKLIVLK
jgi:CBS domain containing-hemolysin-like protein